MAERVCTVPKATAVMLNLLSAALAGLVRDGPATPGRSLVMAAGLHPQQ